MKASRKGFHQVIALVVILAGGLLIGVLVWRLWANRNILVKREQAIQNAIQACPSIVLKPVEQPTDTDAELTTFGTVQGPDNSEPEKPVWVVKMKGRWMLVGGPPPAPDSDPGPFYWDECTIIIDAQTGESLSAPIQ